MPSDQPPSSTTQAHLRVRLWLILAFALLLPLAALAYTRNRVATDANGQPMHISGSVVLIEPDIELSEVLAGGVQEPRKEWTLAARRLYPEVVRKYLSAAHTQQMPDYKIDPALAPDSTLGQIIRLNRAVSVSVLAYTSPGSQLATKKGKPLDWTLGPDVGQLRKATGADYALFTYIRDSYTSSGRATLRVAALLLFGGDIGGGTQIGVTTLVDLRTGQVVWFNFLAKQTGDLRDEAGTTATVENMLEGIPL